MLSSIYFNQNDVYNLLHISGLFGQQSSSVKMGLKWPLSRGSQFKLHFYLGWRGNRGSRQSFHVTSFLKGCWLIIPNYRYFNEDKMHNNTNMTWNIMTNLRVKRYVWHKIIKRLFPLVKVNFKATPIERQSL